MYLWSYLAGLVTIPTCWLLWILALAAYWACVDSWDLFRGGLKTEYRWWTWLWAAPALLFVHFARYLIDRANGLERVH